MIRMYCVVAVDLPEQEVCDIALRSILRSVATFEFADLTPSRKASLSCNALCMPHVLDGLEPHQYSATAPSFPSPSKSLDSWEEGPSSPQEHVGVRSTSLFKTQILPLEGKFRALSEAKDSAFTKSHAQELTSNLRDVQFPPAPYQLDTFRAPSLAPDVTTEIGSLYGRPPFGGKCALHRQMIEIEMQRLSVLIAKAADRREDLQQELVFVAASEQRRAKRIATLREVKESNAAIKKEVTARKVALNASVHGDDEDEEMSGTSGPNNNKDIPPRGGPGTPTFNPVILDDDDSDLDAERQAYENTLIASSRG